MQTDQIEMLEQIIADQRAVIEGLKKTIEQMRADGANEIERNSSPDNLDLFNG